MASFAVKNRQTPLQLPCSPHALNLLTRQAFPQMLFDYRSDVFQITQRALSHCSRDDRSTRLQSCELVHSECNNVWNRSCRWFRHTTTPERLYSTVARGILDKYRQDQAVVEAQRVVKDEDGADDETCPAECVRDIYSGMTTSYLAYGIAWFRTTFLSH